MGEKLLGLVTKSKSFYILDRDSMVWARKWGSKNSIASGKLARWPEVKVGERLTICEPQVQAEIKNSVLVTLTSPVEKFIEEDEDFCWNEWASPVKVGEYVKRKEGGGPYRVTSIFEDSICFIGLEDANGGKSIVSPMFIRDCVKCDGPGTKKNSWVGEIVVWESMGGLDSGCAETCRVVEDRIDSVTVLLTPRNMSIESRYTVSKSVLTKFDVDLIGSVVYIDSHPKDLWRFVGTVKYPKAPAPMLAILEPIEKIGFKANRISVALQEVRLIHRTMVPGTLVRTKASEHEFRHRIMRVDAIDFDKQSSKLAATVTTSVEEARRRPAGTVLKYLASELVTVPDFYSGQRVKLTENEHPRYKDFRITEMIEVESTDGKNIPQAVRIRPTDNPFDLLLTVPLHILAPSG